MNILLDLQGAQTESRHRGIGRYLREFTRALLPLSDQHGHTVQILLNDRFPDAARGIRKDLHGLVPPTSFRIFSPLGRLPQSDIKEDERHSFNDRLLQAVITECQPDVLLVGSLFEEHWNAVTAVSQSKTVQTAVITYDLIPLLHPGNYLTNSTTRLWYQKKLEELKRADLLLSISTSTKEEIERHLDIKADQVESISTGSSSGFFSEVVSPAEQAMLKERFGLKGRFIYGNGLVEPRKNLEGLIRAYELLPKNLQDSHKLCISTTNSQSVETLQKLARTLGIPSKQLILVGRVIDSDLALLYRACAVFVFPSWHEGFGLPVLEAMQCGAAVLTSNVSSLPEVMGRPDALFDPFDPKAIATLLARILTEESFRLDLKAYGPRQAQLFRWEKTASRAMAAMEKVVSSRPDRSTRTVPLTYGKPRLAYVAPLNHQGLLQHNHHLAVIEELRKNYMVSEITEGNQSELKESQGNYDKIMIALADHPAYGYALDLLETVPAVVELLDSCLSRLYHSKGIHRWLLELFRSNGYQSMLAVAESHSLSDLNSCSTTDSLEHLSLGVIHPGQPLARIAEQLERLYHSAKPKLALLNDPTTIELAAKSSVAASAIGHSLAFSFPISRQRLQLLLDVSILVRHDAGTGIQRVCKGILAPLLKNPPLGWKVEPIYLNEDGKYYYARDFCCRFLGLAEGLVQDEIVDPGAKDIFLGLDLNPELPRFGMDILTEWAIRGISIHFIVYDILPIRLPECFGLGLQKAFEDWLAKIAGFNSLICISKAVADDLDLWLKEHPDLANPVRTVRWFHLGAKVDGTQPSRGLPENAQQVLAELRAGLSFLCVATLEPRKGHAQLLAAADLLWDRGEHFNLVLVGRAGWNVERLVETILQHPLLGTRLFWLEGISDEYLKLVYGAVSCYVNTSRGEGFGLPIVEAASYSVPLLLRDLPVFKEVAGVSARYFSGEDPEDLATALESWLRDNEQSPIPLPSELTTITWEESAKWLTTILEEESPEIAPPTLGIYPCRQNSSL